MIVAGVLFERGYLMSYLRKPVLRFLIVMTFVLLMIFTSGPLPAVAGGFMYGDVNVDSRVSVEDAILILQHLARLHRLENLDFLAADVIGSGAVNIVDAVMVMRKAHNLIEAGDFPAQAKLDRAVAAVEAAEANPRDSALADIALNLVSDLPAIPPRADLLKRLEKLGDIAAITFDKVYRDGVYARYGKVFYEGVESIVPGVYNIYLDKAKIKTVMGGPLQTGQQLKIAINGQFIKGSSIDGGTSEVFVDQGDWYTLPAVQQSLNPDITSNPIQSDMIQHAEDPIWR